MVGGPAFVLPFLHYPYALPEDRVPTIPTQKQQRWGGVAQKADLAAGEAQPQPCPWDPRDLSGNGTEAPHGAEF